MSFFATVLAALYLFNKGRSKLESAIYPTVARYRVLVPGSLFPWLAAPLEHLVVIGEGSFPESIEGLSG
jgi:hypothetical protein